MTATHRKKKRSRKGDDVKSVVSSVVEDFNSEYVDTLGKDSGLILADSWIPSSCHPLNFICGDPIQGAFPQGRTIELFGPRSSGKSMIVYDAGANCQRMGGIFVLLDSESSYHVQFGEHLGIDNSTMIYGHFRTVEEGFDFMIEVIEGIRSKGFEGPILVGYDSIAGSTTEKALRDSFEDDKRDMTKAGIISAGMSKLNTLAYRMDATVLITNQIRKRIGVMYGNPETRPGGEAIPFFASVSIGVRRLKKVKKTRGGKRVVVGHQVKLTCDKNKVRPPFLEATVLIHLDRVRKKYKLDPWYGMGDLLVDAGVMIRRKGRRYEFSSGDPDGKFKESEFGEIWEEHIVPVLDIDYYSPEDSG